MNSPQVKLFGDERILAGDTLLVIDLADCSGMDSTFMGTLAGLASRIAAKSGGKLQIADASARNRASLEDLGLDFMMEINPPLADWLPRICELRGLLKPHSKSSSLPSVDHARHVLEAHRTLSQVNDSNAKAFENVVQTLEDQVADPRKPAAGQER